MRYTKQYKKKDVKRGYSMEIYRITYKQKFSGKVLEDSYIKRVRSHEEIDMAIEALYDDPCVFAVEAIRINSTDEAGGGNGNESI